MRRTLVTILFGIGLALPGAAQAAGGPVPPQQGGAGASAPGIGKHFVTIADRRSTIVQRVTGGTVERYRRIAGSWGVPGAAYDGSTTGLSGNGRTLVLEQNSTVYPPKTTRLAVLETVRLKPVAHVTLPGLYTVDAISPDGSLVYLIHYQSISQTARYEVRAYDLDRRELLPQPIVDPREPDEKMQGFPLVRLMSPDGRWAYTLYQRPSESPFIHALDTLGRRAFCVDLPQGAADGNITMSLGGGALQVLKDGSPVALMSTTTFAVRRPAAAPDHRPSRKPRSHPDGGSGFPWEFGAIPAVAALTAAALALRRRQPSRPVAS